MDKIRNVAVLVGSLRKDSINRKVANALIELAPAGLKLSEGEIGHLPIYNQDVDENPPVAWSQFRERIRAVDAVLFVTPEHNRSVPAALKNAIDVGSRPYGKSAWSGKPGAVVSASPGAIGGFERQSPFTAIACPEYSGDAAARSLYRPCRQAVRRERQAR
jgi:chromate reductase, NAD(P)H dehydrogenase (quinone)